MSSSTWYFWGSSLGLKCTVGLMTYSSPYLAFYRKRRSEGGSRIVNRWDLAVLPLHTRPTSLRRFHRDPRPGPDEGEFYFFLTYVRTHWRGWCGNLTYETLLSLSSSSSSFLFTQFRVRPFRECNSPSAAMEAERPLRYQRVRVYSNFCNRVMGRDCKDAPGKKKTPNDAGKKVTHPPDSSFVFEKIILFISFGSCREQQVLAITCAIGYDVCHFHWALASPKQVTIVWHWNNETSWWCDESFRCRSRKFSVLSFSLPSTLASRWHDTRCMTRLFISSSRTSTSSAFDNLSSILFFGWNCCFVCNIFYFRLSRAAKRRAIGQQLRLIYRNDYLSLCVEKVLYSRESNQKNFYKEKNSNGISIERNVMGQVFKVAFI